MHAAAHAIAAREQPAHLAGLDPVDRAAQERPEVDAAKRLQEERVEEEGAELAVAGPGLALAQALEGADVDEDRPCPAPLDVVGRCVLQGQSLVERAAEKVELEERRVPEHRERPLVRVGDERDRRVAEDAGRVAKRGGYGAVLELLGGDELSVRRGLREEPARGERLPVLEALGRERAEDLAVRDDDPAQRVAKRARLEGGRAGLRLRARRPSSSGAA